MNGETDQTRFGRQGPGRLNGLMIAALANAGAQLAKAGWIGMAHKPFGLSPQP